MHAYILIPRWGRKPRGAQSVNITSSVPRVNYNVQCIIENSYEYNLNTFPGIILKPETHELNVAQIIIFTIIVVRTI